MVSDKPPRRSRSGKTPVTIDLAASEASVIAEPVRSDDTDAAQNAPQLDASAMPAQSVPADGDAAAPGEIADTAATEPGAADASNPETISEPSHTLGHEDRAAQASVEEPLPFDATPDVPGTAATDTQTDREPVGPAETPSETAQPQLTKAEEIPMATAGGAHARPDAAVAPASSGAKTSAMLASGILGGLVALFLAGSMQYAGVIPALNPQTSSATTAEMDELRQQIATLRSAPAPGGALEQRLKALENSAAGNNQSGLEQQVASLKAELDQLKSTAQAVDANGAQLGQRLETLETKVAQPGREQAVARALSAAALKAATERGGSFQAELQTFAQVAGDDPAVASLQPYADKGAATRAELARRMPAATGAILDAVHQPAEGEGITNRLFSGAMRLVKVRPVGEVEGDTPEAIVARVEERVKNGDLKAAAAEWDKLPDTAKQAATDFKQALDARIAIDDLMNGTLTRAMASAGSNG